MSNNTKAKQKPKTNKKAKQNQVKTSTSKESTNKIVIYDICYILVATLGLLLILSAGSIGKECMYALEGLFGIVAFIFPYFFFLFSIINLIKSNTNPDKTIILLFFMFTIALCMLNSLRFLDNNISYGIDVMNTYYSLGSLDQSAGIFGMFLGILSSNLFGRVGIYIVSLSIFAIMAIIAINKYKPGVLTKEEKMINLGNKNKDEKLKKEKMDKEKTNKGKIDALTEHQSDKKQSNFSLFKKKDNNVLEYMNDNSLFSLPKSNTKGLEAKSVPKAGYGLDGKKVDSNLVVEPFTKVDNAKKIEKGITLDLTDELKDIEKLAKEDREKKRTSGNVDKKNSKLLEKEKKDGGEIKEKYTLPSLNFLHDPIVVENNTSSDDLRNRAMKLEETLESFNVAAKVVKVTQGPTVTRFEVQPDTGVKVNAITRLADDIALNLKAKSIRIEAPIPGKAAVGIEIENENINMVCLKEIIDSAEFKKAKSKISFAVGKDISGKAIVSDLKSMPHLLIAGSTGSGKSVCINSIITSILYRSTPDEVKLILIDPKVVELGEYNGIPHLLIPVVTDPNKASAALAWAVNEMLDRYKKFAKAGAKDIASFNKAQKEEKMPQVVIIIDELADLMMAAPSQVEDSICRLAQMARAAGMHLIVATQRPSVNVITGVIKANIPSRIAFAVSSQFDSRTILDMAGAEKLVGKGDMLFHPLGSGKPTRVQGAFVSDDEVSKVIEFIKENSPDAEYSEEILSTIEKGNVINNGGEEDELLYDAMECVVSSNQASTSMLQRRFRIGYNRAARIIEDLEDMGIISQQDGNKQRQVLMTKSEYRELMERRNS